MIALPLFLQEELHSADYLRVPKTLISSLAQSLMSFDDSVWRGRLDSQRHADLPGDNQGRAS